jgi:hypothetical protein
MLTYTDVTDLVQNAASKALGRDRISVAAATQGAAPGVRRAAE